jgi:hypothetical protein
MLDDPTRALYRAPELVFIGVGSVPGFLEARRARCFREAGFSPVPG